MNNEPRQTDTPARHGETAVEDNAEDEEEEDQGGRMKRSAVND